MPDPTTPPTTPPATPPTPTREIPAVGRRKRLRFGWGWKALIILNLYLVISSNVAMTRTIAEMNEKYAIAIDAANGKLPRPNFVIGFNPLFGLFEGLADGFMSFFGPILNVYGLLILIIIGLLITVVMLFRRKPAAPTHTS